MDCFQKHNHTFTQQPRKGLNVATQAATSPQGPVSDQSGNKPSLPRRDPSNYQLNWIGQARLSHKDQTLRIQSRIKRYLYAKNSVALSALLNRLLKETPSAQEENNNMELVLEVLTADKNLRWLFDWAIESPDQVITHQLTQRGFLDRVELLGAIRIHFFVHHKDITPQNEESFVHQHKTSFVARILNGGYCHKHFQFVNGSDNETMSERLQEYEFNDFGSLEKREGIFEIARERMETLSKFDWYLLTEQQMHSVSKVQEDTITILLRGQTRNERPGFFKTEEEFSQTEQIPLDRASAVEMMKKLRKIYSQKDRSASSNHDTSIDPSALALLLDQTLCLQQQIQQRDSQDNWRRLSRVKGSQRSLSRSVSRKVRSFAAKPMTTDKKIIQF